MKEIGRSKTYAAERIYYYDEQEDRLVSKICEQDIGDNLDLNKELAHEFRPHQKGNIRAVAEIPATLFLKWLTEEGVDGFCSNDAIDMLVNRKLRDPQNKYLLTVPDNYRMMKHG